MTKPDGTLPAFEFSSARTQLCGQKRKYIVRIYTHDTHTAHDIWNSDVARRHGVILGIMRRGAWHTSSLWLWLSASQPQTSPIWPRPISVRGALPRASGGAGEWDSSYTVIRCRLALGRSSSARCHLGHSDTRSMEHGLAVSVPFSAAAANLDNFASAKLRQHEVVLVAGQSVPTTVRS